MHAAPTTYDRRAVLTAAVFGLAVLAGIVSLVVAMIVAHQQTSGIVPAPVPVAPAAPAIPAPVVEQPPVLIPDNA